MESDTQPLSVSSRNAVGGGGGGGGALRDDTKNGSVAD